MQTRTRLAIALLIAAVGVITTYYYLTGLSKSYVSSNGSVRLYTYRVVRTLNHDPEAFTQGLTYGDGTFYESTGLRGKSTLRQVDPETGRVTKLRRLPDELFGEGITLHGDRIIQLTYTSNLGIVYDKQSFEPTGQFTYPTEGWGITSDGTRLIMSDGTATLYLLDPETFEASGQMEVTTAGRPVEGLNELEYIRGEIYANVWPTDRIAKISPRTGHVTGWIQLSGLGGPQDQSDPTHMPNGIAYDASHDRLFVTGKLWPRVYEIQLVELGSGGR